MAFKVNYAFERAERERAKQAKKAAKAAAKQLEDEEAAKPVGTEDKQGDDQTA